MMRTIVCLAAILVAAAPAAAIEARPYIHATPPAGGHPYPQGAPYFVIGGVSHAPTELRYAEIDGRRVLVEATSGEVVYRLRP